MAKQRKQAGFNVLELMVVLFVAGILMTVGLPAFTGFMANNQMSTAANDIATSLHLARTEAIKRRASITICPSTEWSTATPDCTATNFRDGWIIFVDALPPAVPDLAHTGAQDILYTHGPLADRITMTAADVDSVIGGGQFLVFGPNGFPLAQLAGNDAVMNFQMCDHRGNVNTGGGIAAGRWIQLTPTGRPQIYREQADVQSAANPTAGC